MIKSVGSGMIVEMDGTAEELLHEYRDITSALYINMIGMCGISPQTAEKFINSASVTGVADCKRGGF